MKITVLGSGGWGTALALLLLENGHEVTLWSYTEEESRVLRETRENPMLKGVPLPETMGLTTDMGAVKGCGAVVMATPSFAVRATAAKLKQLADEAHVRDRSGYMVAVLEQSILRGWEGLFPLKDDFVDKAPVQRPANTADRPREIGPDTDITEFL